MIAVSNAMHVSHVTNFPLSHILIEVTTAILTLPNFENLQVTLIYRSPSVPISILLSVMSSILSQATNSSMKNIILGDFNEDLLSNSDSRLLSLMSNHRFSQLVHSPTADNGTLLDHVYRLNAIECMSLIPTILTVMESSLPAAQQHSLTFPVMTTDMTDEQLTPH